jgi:hypothetical protein
VRCCFQRGSFAGSGCHGNASIYFIGNYKKMASWGGCPQGPFFGWPASTLKFLDKKLFTCIAWTEAWKKLRCAVTQQNFLSTTKQKTSNKFLFVLLLYCSISFFFYT